MCVSVCVCVGECVCVLVSVRAYIYVGMMDTTDDRQTGDL